ncbi:TIGR02444 family protein [Alteromonas gilva]|uniref:TIGR02444 family protein n=1 Tax=Alteromonas gilva TaxID=2987522 RepID=A0ABT5KYP4_9ALTE|nr:TIGR02444 family protein [Alteromonas gilva]MDC8829326.1 TIGR02444 family protein [Alteromonas gilva]
MTQLTKDTFWQHSVAVYTKEGVAKACLTLQDQYQVNVNLLLLLHWCITHQYQVDDALLTRLRQAVAQTDPVIQAHRQQRRNAKGTEHYETLKAMELELEAQQQAALVAVLNQSQPIDKAGDSSDNHSIQVGKWLNLPDSHQIRQLISKVINT